MPSSSSSLFSLLQLVILFSAAALFLSTVANPILPNGVANLQKEKKFSADSPPSSSLTMRGFFPAARSWAHAPILMPYSDGSGFVSPFPSGLSDRWSGFMAEEQFAGGAPNKRTAEGHFMEPSGWPGLGEPGRLEWNFNRLK